MNKPLRDGCLAALRSLCGLFIVLFLCAAPGCVSANQVLSVPYICSLSSSSGHTWAESARTAAVPCRFAPEFTTHQLLTNTTARKLFVEAVMHCMLTLAPNTSPLPLDSPRGN